jgi:uncharacterized protein (TIGR02118 family)
MIKVSVLYPSGEGEAGGHLLFESVEAYDAGFGPHAKEIMADIPNYTNARPTLLISEIVK